MFEGSGMRVLFDGTRGIVKHRVADVAVVADHSRALADVAVDTLEPGVRRVLKRDKLRLHYGVARLSAKRYRLTVLKRLVAAESADGNKQKRNAEKHKKEFSAVWII